MTSWILIWELLILQKPHLFIFSNNSSGKSTMSKRLKLCQIKSNAALFQLSYFWEDNEICINSCRQHKYWITIAMDCINRYTRWIKTCLIYFSADGANGLQGLICLLQCYPSNSYNSNIFLFSPSQKNKVDVINNCTYIILFLWRPILMLPM